MANSTGNSSNVFPSFFSNHEMDVSKYLSLYEDLQEHDLLGSTSTTTSQQLDLTHILNFDDFDLNLNNDKFTLLFDQENDLIRPNQPSSSGSLIGRDGGMGRGKGIPPPGFEKNNEEENIIEDDDNVWSDFEKKQLAALDSLCLDDDEDDEKEENKRISNLNKKETKEKNPIKILRRSPPGLSPKTDKKDVQSLYTDTFRFDQADQSITTHEPKEKNQSKERQGLPHGKRMSINDVSFVLHEHLKQIRCSDPFSDDYYFYSSIYQKHVKSLKQQSMSCPLPSWQLEHIQSYDPRDAQVARKSREWESKNKVLGRNNKSSLYRQNESIVLDDDVPKKFDEDLLPTTKVIMSKDNPPFQAEQWKQRHYINIAMRYLLALQDAKHILNSKDIDIVEFREQDSATMYPALLQLRNKIAHITMKLSNVLGANEILPAGEGAATYEMDDERVNGLLSTPKGIKLFCRSLPLLLPQCRFAFLPLLTSFLLAKDHGGFSTFVFEEVTPDNFTSINKLSETLVLLTMYHPPLPPSYVFASCLEKIISTHDTMSLGVILHERVRAEALQAILQKGKEVCSECGDITIQNQWLKWETEFIRLASAVKAMDTSLNRFE